MEATSPEAVSHSTGSGGPPTHERGPKRWGRLAGMAACRCPAVAQRDRPMKHVQRPEPQPNGHSARQRSAGPPGSPPKDALGPCRHSVKQTQPHHLLKSHPPRAPYIGVIHDAVVHLASGSVKRGLALGRGGNLQVSGGQNPGNAFSDSVKQTQSDYLLRFPPKEPHMLGGASCALLRVS